MDLTPELKAALAKMQGGATEAQSASATQPADLVSLVRAARKKAGVGRKGGNLLDTRVLTAADVAQLGALVPTTTFDGESVNCYVVDGTKIVPPATDTPAQAGDVLELILWDIDGRKTVKGYLYR